MPLVPAMVMFTACRERGLMRTGWTAQNATLLVVVVAGVAVAVAALHLGQLRRKTLGVFQP